ncbi:MAG: pyruvate kinase [Planctomycetes bacterium]|nr:pyruvate kinase [Planctomycetota bacterium]
MHALITRLSAIHQNMRAFATSHQDQLANLDRRFERSAANLLEYLALRRHDLREVQTQLARLGLSSLGRSEAHARATVEAVLRALHALAGMPPFRTEGRTLSFEQGDRLLERHTVSLLGPTPQGRNSRIMVTMPSEAATDYTLVRDLVEGGMNVMRINCAHDSQTEWQAMIRNLRKACRNGSRQCLVLMDLAGPKLRTGVFEPGPTAFKLSAQRDNRGRLLAPARLLLLSERPSAPLPACDAQLHVPGALLSALQPGTRLRITDTRGRMRTPVCVQSGRGWRLIEARKSCYIDNGVKLRVRGGPKFKVAGLEPEPGELIVRIGDVIALTVDPRAGRMGTRFMEGEDRVVAVVPCTLPEVIAQVKMGEPIWFDDGKIGGVVICADATELLIEVTQAKESGSKLAADKGINIPKSNLRLDALTAKDKEDLAFVAKHADLVGLSFANRPEDVLALQEALAAHEGQSPSIVLKIETQRGFANLAPILLAAMRSYPVAVMIARGDLAVECGFERLAEVQEEILWICEAAHVPVIWATQVLETLAKKGAPTRAEITDAAMAERAECVMLNKGPHVVKAVRTLDDILRRMQGHQAKKSAMLRELSIANNSWAEATQEKE